MPTPRIESVLERRLLVNYRLDPEATARVLPPGLRPDLVNGFAVGGICLVRLGRARPAGLPGAIGLRSENAAHRIAVAWDGPDGEARRGVYIARRDTASRVVALVGGRVFPGEHHLARFAVRENDGEIRISLAGRDRGLSRGGGKGGGHDVSVRVAPTAEWPGGELFANLEAASRFFREAPVAYSARTAGSTLDGLELQAERWRIEPAVVVEARSGFFEDPSRFPSGGAEIDCALMMRNIPATWLPRPARESESESERETSRAGRAPAPSRKGQV